MNFIGKALWGRAVTTTLWAICLEKLQDFWGQKEISFWPGEEHLLLADTLESRVIQEAPMEVKLEVSFWWANPHNLTTYPSSDYVIALTFNKLLLKGTVENSLLIDIQTLDKWILVNDKLLKDDRERMIRSFSTLVGFKLANEAEILAYKKA